VPDYLSEVSRCQSWQSTGLALTFDRFSNITIELAPANAASTAVRIAALRGFLINFISPWETQKILERFDYGSAVSDYGFKRWYRTRQHTQRVEKQIPAGGRRFANLCENIAASSQMAAVSIRRSAK
jgi:hypothetical protein